MSLTENNAKGGLSIIKSSQPHRIIKTKAASVDQDHTADKAVLQPLSVRDSRIYHNQNGSSEIVEALSLPKIVGSVSSRETNANQSLEHLKQKVKELEKENYKLCHHVKQAEQSIKNYRGYLSKQQSHPSLTTTNCSSQTEPDLPQTQTKTAEYDALLKQLSTMELANRDLVLSNSALMAENSQLRAENSAQSSIQSTLSQFEVKVVSQQLQISKLEESLAMSKIQAPVIISPKKNHIPENPSLNDLQDQLSSVAMLKRFCESTKSEVESKLLAYQQMVSAEFAVLLHKIASNFQDEFKQFEDRVSQLVGEKHQVEVRMNSLNQELVKAKSDLSQVIVLHQRQLQQIAAQHTSPNKAKSVSPLVAKHSSGSSSATKLQRDKASSPAAALSPKGAAPEDRVWTEECRRRLQAAAAELLNLQMVHAAQVKAVQHLSHVRDLVRVAKERETTLERERMVMQLKNQKEVESILVFSLNTAEQSLLETQPHAVAKLIEGRKKRLKLLEFTMAGRMRDIDQRSSETCAGNSAHLEGFQRKAVDNAKLAEEMTKAATIKVLDALRYEDVLNT